MPEREGRKSATSEFLIGWTMRNTSLPLFSILPLCVILFEKYTSSEVKCSTEKMQQLCMRIIYNSALPCYNEITIVLSPCVCEERKI